MSAVYNSTVQGFYLSYYGRPADPAGLTFWTGQLAAAGGNLSAILNAFGTSAEATRRYGTGTTESKIQAVYQQTFGRAADAAGLAFYNTEITAGRITLIDMSKRIIDGATGDDVAIRNNRLSAAQSFTDKLDTDAEKAGYSGSGAEDAARAWVATVTKDAATVTAAVATADSTITSLLPQTFTLTTSADKWTGSTGNDSVSGGTSALSASDTLGGSDQIDGGSGADTATFAIGKNFNGFTVGTGFMKGIETVNLNNTSTVAYNFVAKAVTGVDTFNVTGPINVSALDRLATSVNLKGITETQTISVSFNDDVVLGAADATTVGVDGLGRAPASTSPTVLTSSVTLSTSGIETLNLVATGTNFMSLASAGGVENVVVSGAGSLMLGDTTAYAPATDANKAGVATATKTFDGSKMTGAANLFLANATGMTSVKTGTGADQIRVNSTALAGNALIDAGDGADQLALNVNADITAAYRMTGVESIVLNSNNGTRTINFSGANATGITGITVANTYSNTGTQSFTSLGSGDISVSLSPNGTTSGTNDLNATGISIGNTGKGLITIPVAASATTAQTSADGVTFTHAPTVEMTLPTLSAFNGTLGATRATSASITGSGTITNATVSGAGVGALDLPAATSLTLDKTSASGAWVLAVTNSAASTDPMTSLTIKNAGTSTSATGNMDLTGSTAFGELTSLSVTTAGNIAVVSTTENFTKLTSLTASGTADGSQFSVGNLGSSTQAYGLSVSASGLKGGFTMGTGQVGAGQAISIDVSGRTGTTATTIGDLDVTNSSAERTGSITVNAKNSAASGTLSIGTGQTVTAATVSLDASGSSFGTIVFPGVLGNSVTVKANSAATSFTPGTIGVRDSLVYEAPELVAVTQTINASAASTTSGSASTGSTALTISLKGSIAGDTFNVNGATTTTSITVSGSTGAGSDTVNVDVSGRTVAATSTGITVNLSGLSGTETLTTNITGTGGVDTITGTSGNDRITAGRGADSITLGSGTDRVTLNNPIDTGQIASGASSGLTVTRLDSTTYVFNDAATIRTGDKVSAATFDKVYNFGSGDSIVTNAALNATANTSAGVQAFASSYGTGTDFATGASSTALLDVFISGTLNADGTFTFTNSNASDTLYVFDSNSSGGANDDLYAIVLVGYVLGSKVATGSGTGIVGAALPS